MSKELDDKKLADVNGGSTDPKKEQQRRMRKMKQGIGCTQCIGVTERNKDGSAPKFCAWCGAPLVDD